MGNYRLVRLTGIIVLAGLLASCGSGGETAVAGAAAVRVTMIDNRFTPNVWAVSAQQGLSVVLDNRGSVAHTWSVLLPDQSIQSSAQLKEHMILFRTQVAPEAGRSVVMHPPAPGVYQVVCEIPGHFEAGMHGYLDVAS